MSGCVPWFWRQECCWSWCWRSFSPSANGEIHSTAAIFPAASASRSKQESNGVTYTQAHGGHTLFKIHASKVVQLKQGNALLHDVKIELYGADGKSVDRISGSEFEYDAKAGLAKAPGRCEITVMRPGVAPAIAPQKMQSQPLENKIKAPPLAADAATAASGEIHVETSGLTFDWKSGVATTDQHVDFSMVQGTGSSMGASFDSQNGSAGARSRGAIGHLPGCSGGPGCRPRMRSWSATTSFAA